MSAAGKRAAAAAFRRAAAIIREGYRTLNIEKRECVTCHRVLSEDWTENQVAIEAEAAAAKLIRNAEKLERAAETEVESVSEKVRKLADPAYTPPDPQRNT